MAAVAIDMSPAYFQAVTENLPQAEIVFDWFHIVKLLNDKLTQLRRELYREATKMDKLVLKGTRWLLLMRPENLSDERDERKRLREALQLNGIRVLQTFTKTLATYRRRILAWFQHPISTGPLEGLNNKIKTRQAYGFRDQQYLKLTILAMHTAKFRLIG